METLVEHECVKNCGHSENGISAKAMEPLATCRLVNKAPLHGMKIVGICMDDDTSTKAQLREDTGPNSRGTMSAELSVLKFYADPSHRKKTYNKGLYKLFSAKISKRLGKYFASWSADMKCRAFEVMKEARLVPVLHSSGDHSKCHLSKDDWCLALRAKKAGKVYDRKPVFDINKPKDLKNLKLYEEYHSNMVTDDRLMELRHPFHTNINESLNMRSAEVAPKHKNFSRSNSLRYRIQHVIGVHNMGPKNFYLDVFKDLNIESSKILEVWLNSKETTRKRKKINRKKHESKRKRVHKRNAKTKEALLQERIKDPKVGTYGAGIGVHGEIKKRKRSIERSYCSCGGKAPHKNKSSKHCLLSKLETV